uniref:Tetratricopeptide repeat protein 17-like n=1 Tax=Phallusia mammillata TaxID=59560 RepID=A0A6F9DWH3_9ASCI|nr:tetratricopeptide repeat protein 17-like [Phallusia mammillata]
MFSILRMHSQCMLSIVCALLLALQSQASTHWVVTEDGRIQQQLESPFAMKKPEDLVTFMRQETKHEYLKKMKEKLLQEQEDIDSNEDKDTDLESRHYRRDKDCRSAGKRLPDFDMFVTSVLPLDHKDVEIYDHIKKRAKGPFMEPNCSTLVELPFSIHAYDHLKGVQDRKNIPKQPMLGLKATLSFLEDEKNAATVIYEALQKNKTSWVLYNLASFYWRMKGDMDAAIECIRRALHYSPEEMKDVALVNLANILHRAHYTLNATAVMHHVLDISDAYNVNYFSIANMYAVLGEYNESIYYYEQTLKGQSDFQAAKSRLSAVKCQFKLQEKLEAQHQSLQRTLRELQKYKVKHEDFLEKQNNFYQLRLSAKTQVDQHMYYEHQRIKEGTFNHKCQVRGNKSGSVLVCNLPTASSGSTSTSKKHPVDYVVDSVKPIPAVAMHKIEISSMKFGTTADGTLLESPVDVAQNVDNLKDENENVVDENNDNVTSAYRQAQYDWRDPSWPPQESCDKYVDHYPAWDEFPSAYVDPETRGFKSRELLTTYIGVAQGEMHPTPWKLPDCAELEQVEGTAYDNIPGIDIKDVVVMFKQDTYLNNFLLMHVNEGRVWPDDLGQRILTAIEKAQKTENEENLWVLYNLAGLFWRVNGNNTKAVQCLRHCLRHVPEQHSDIPLISLSNIMYRVGKLNDAVNLLIYALRANNSEPAAYLSMGNALQAQENITGAVEFYNYAMVLHQQYREAFHALLVVKCFNLKRLKQQQQTDAILNSWEKSKSAPVASEVEEIDTDASTCTGDHVTCQNVEKKSNGDETHKSGDIEESQEKLEDNTDTNEAAVDIAVKLREGKTDASELLKDTDDAINDLINSSGGELDQKLLSAKKLMEQLAEMRNSLGNLVHEAATALDIIDDGEEEINCDEIVAAVDFTYQPDKNEEFWSLDFTDLLSVENEEESFFDPTCELSDLPQLYDVSGMTSVVNRDQFTNYTSDPLFMQLLREVIGDAKSVHEVAYILAVAMHANPTSWRVSMLVSYFWRAQGDAKEVLNCLIRSLVSAPTANHHTILFSLADFLARLPNIQDAIHLLDQALNLHPSSHRLHQLAANIYASAGDYANAKKHFEETLNLHSACQDCQRRKWAASCLLKQNQP